MITEKEKIIRMPVFFLTLFNQLVASYWKYLAYKHVATNNNKMEY